MQGLQKNECIFDFQQFIHSLTMKNASFLKVCFIIPCISFSSFNPKILKGFNLNRRSAKLITPNEIGGEESDHNLSPELKIDEVKGFNIYILKIFNPLRGRYRVVSISPSSACYTGGYSNLTYFVV